MIGHEELADASLQAGTENDPEALFEAEGIDYEALGQQAAALSVAALSRLELGAHGGQIVRGDITAAIMNAYLAGAEVALRAKQG